jgi:tetratricopeptide (TPR) repeat protein
LPVLIEKIPFIAVALAVTITTLHFFVQKQFLAPHDSFPVIKRILVSGNAVFEYCRLMIIPVGILPLHMTPEQIPFSYVVKTVAVLLIFAAALFAAKWQQEIPAVLLCFIIPLLPILAFFQAGDQSFAARYTYISAVVPGIAASALVSSAYNRAVHSGHFRLKIAIIAVIALILVVFSLMTDRLINVWRDSGTLWSRQIAFQPIGRAFNARGYFYMQSGMYAEAVNDFTRAIEIIQSRQELSEDNVLAFRGEALRKLGRNSEALTDFTAAIALYPHRAYYYHRALALQSLGKMKEAEQDFAIAGDETGPIEWFADE